MEDISSGIEEIKEILSSILNDQPPKFLTREKAAEFLKISLPTLDRKLKEGKIKGYRASDGESRIIRFKLSDLEAYLVPIQTTL